MPRPYLEALEAFSNRNTYSIFKWVSSIKMSLLH